MADDNLANSEQESTQKLTPFERTVLKRFDQIDARFNQVDDRLNMLEVKALDTKPIWEQALAEILHVKAEVVEIKDRLQRVEGSLGILVEDVVKVRADLQGFNRRIIALEKA